MTVDGNLALIVISKCKKVNVEWVVFGQLTKLSYDLYKVCLRRVQR
jgi:hypothetical protein